ncbi:helix-turn-helix domain-containing protein [Dyadobacter pollutisoli]|uniref:Helix-turn-helix domain-containing protein n=1 Tax=Dyadobacter pollutisoli TaxID=2910158 RepID=A0A9E8N9T8_9BACT|nr:helix-turn-helix domain-containing protein [Dyadobacter pollutisoli]WAC12634.1 helix-turn-helix domain-containing protein [Dyadobacter pollutisoli]
MKSSEKVLLDKFNEVIESNFHNSDFGIDEICLELGTSRSQLYRYIKEQTQLSTSLYIRQRKLLKAQELLESSDMKTAEIAYLLSIDSPQNFSKYFAQEFGLTPTAYRKKTIEEKGLSDSKPVVMEEIFSAAKTGTGNHTFIVAPVNVKPNDTFAGRKYLYLVIGLILFMAWAAYFWKPLGEKGNRLAGVPAFSGNSIAIMPFKNLGKPETVYFSDGIMDQIHGSLSLLNKLKVISTTSSGKYRNSPKLIPQIARELDVNYILEGSVLQANQKLRINVELVRANDDRTVWTKSYDGGTKDVFSFLSNVAKEVALELDQKLSNTAEEKLRKVPTNNPEAYRAYLQGCQLIVIRKKEYLEESIVKLNRAIKLDPEFAAAYASLGHAYHLMAENGFMEETESFKMTEQNSLTAIRLDAENGLAYANLANIYRLQNKWEQAKTAYEIALKYSPNDAQINYWFSLLLRSTGNMEEAIRYSSKAVALDPLHHVIFGGNITNHVYGGELDRAEELVNDGKVLFKDSWVYYWVKGIYFAAMKDYKQALASYAKANQLNPGIKSIQYQTVFCQAMNGQINEANAYLSQLPNLPANYVSRAVIYAGLKDKKQSLYYLQKAADADILPTDIKVSLFLASLRNEQQYKTILAKFGL